MKRVSTIISLILISFSGQSNNIQVANVSTIVTGGNILIEFDLSWDNSWRSASTNNYDGAWLFMKFKDVDGKWKHLHFTGNNITIPAGYTLNVSNNGSNTGIGAFIHRSALGSGTVTLTNIRAGVQTLPGIFDVKLFALEMVYIPQASFSVGDGNGVAGFSYQTGALLDPFLINGNGASITVGTLAGQLNGYQSTPATTQLTGFPTGYSAVWMMKYELSQGAYRDFLNTLTYDQQKSHIQSPSGLQPNAAVGTLISGNPPDLSSATIRGRLEIASSGSSVLPTTPAIIGCDYDDDNVYDEVNDKEWSAMGYLGWPQAAAYLDWAGLRPMTELEYEKACRGPLAPVLDECAWGNAGVASTPYTLINDGFNNESISNMSSLFGNSNLASTAMGSIVKNTRGGIFATAFSSRISSGAGYYGVMELTGNQNEFVVTTSNAAGRSFTGKLGNGELDEFGYANENYWPGINTNNSINVANTVFTTPGPTGDAGLAIRGGNFSSGALYTVSSRLHGAGFWSIKTAPHGIRGVREGN